MIHLIKCEDSDLLCVHWLGEGLEALVLSESVGDITQEEAEFPECVLFLFLQFLLLLLR